MGGFDTGENGVIAAGAGEHDREANGAKHEDDRGPGGELGEKVGCAAGTEGCLRTLTAEGSGKVGGFALLEENDADDEERDDDVNDNEKNEHRSWFETSWGRRKIPENVWIGAEEGT